MAALLLRSASLSRLIVAAPPPFLQRSDLVPLLKRFLPSSFPVMMEDAGAKAANVAIISHDPDEEVFTFSLVVKHPETKVEKQVRYYFLDDLKASHFRLLG